MIVVFEHALDWVERWHEHGGELGKHDGRGNLLLENGSISPDDPVAQDLVAELRADQALADGVGQIVLWMLARAAADERESDG